MKTINRTEFESTEKTNDEPGYISASAYVKGHRKRYESFGGMNFDDDQVFIKTFSGDYIQLDRNGKWGYISETFKDLVDNANDGICIVLENMRHAYVNRKYCEITGYSDSELSKIRAVELILKEEREAFKRMYQLSFQGKNDKKKNGVATVVRKDGKKCFIEYSKSKISWNGEPALQGIIRDITKNIEKEKMIKETNKRLSNRIEDVTAELVTSSKELKQKQSELLRHKLELENVNKELLQTNRAMSFLAQNIVKQKKEVELNIARTVLTKIMPVINDLKKRKAVQQYIAELEVLSMYIRGLAPETDQYNKILINLSATEMRIATLIKNGMSSQGIADALHISIETVKTHRKKIRSKLEIKNSDANLTSYLRSVIVDA